MLLKIHTYCKGASQVVQVVNNPPDFGRDIRDVGSIPGLRRSPEGGHDSPRQYSCLENPQERTEEAFRQATVHRVTKNWTQVK